MASIPTLLKRRLKQVRFAECHDFSDLKDHSNRSLVGRAFWRKIDADKIGWLIFRTAQGKREFSASIAVTDSLAIDPEICKVTCQTTDDYEPPGFAIQVSRLWSSPFDIWWVVRDDHFWSLREYEPLPSSIGLTPAQCDELVRTHQHLYEQASSQEELMVYCLVDHCIQKIEEYAIPFLNSWRC